MMTVLIRVLNAQQLKNLMELLVTNKSLKPSNKMFSFKCVSSSSNIIRKKNDAIYKNNAPGTTYKNGIVSMNNVYDESGTGYHLNCPKVILTITM